MIEASIDQIFFFLAIATVFFLPGWAILSLLERRAPQLSLLEKLALSTGLSVVTVDFLMIILGVSGVPLRTATVFPAILALSGIVFFFSRRGVQSPKHRPTQMISVAFVFLFAFLVVVKTIFFLPNVLPNSTDLGHHMYWVKRIVLSERLPVYEEREIVESNGKYELAAAHPISDFIIGEHLPLSAIQMISGADFDSSYSMLSLFILHLSTMLALYVLARRLFDFSPHVETIALLTLLLVGVLYAIGPPQMKYISGGVVGNTIGNLLIPLAVFAFLLAVRTGIAAWFSLAIVLSFGLGYTHHLSALLFGFAIVGILLSALLFNRSLFTKQIIPFFRNRSVWLTLFLCAAFFFFVAMPSYIENAAGETIVGAPEKTEHQGFSFWQLVYAIGEPRAVFGLFGIALLIGMRRFCSTEAMVILSGWIGLWCFLVLFPDIARIDLPSGRVANYLIFPFSILAAFGLSWLFSLLRAETPLPQWMRRTALFLVLGMIVFNGFSDNAKYLGKLSSGYAQTIALSDASEFLATRIPEDVHIVHDHINITGDSWIKLSFMRDYNYPFYRAHLFRYDRVSDRNERCTLWAISSPNTDEARQCADDLGIGAVFVNEAIDGAQFQHFKNYNRVYADPYFSAYVVQKNN